MQLLGCEIQHYDWGDAEAIPRLLGLEIDGRPHAELWMGAHARGCSRLADGTSLADHIENDPVATLGRRIAAEFGQLPFLFKVLAAAEPLSIQSHPTLAQARAGYDKENEAGVPIDAFHRVYRDPNHKPELIAALTPFEAKCGFRPTAESRNLIGLLVDEGASALEPVRAILRSATPDEEIYRQVLSHVLAAGAGDEAELVRQTVDACKRLVDDPAAGAFRAELEWTGRIAEAFPDDSGVVVALFLNHVRLAPGEAIFLDAGNLHAYLSGVGMELMANSDNVVRGGLTPKHRDIPELLNVVDFEPREVPVQTPTEPDWTYESPVPEFLLDRIGPGRRDHDVASPEILFVEHGSAEIESADAQMSATAGSAVWIPASVRSYSLVADGTVWRARV